MQGRVTTTASSGSINSLSPVWSLGGWEGDSSSDCLVPCSSSSSLHVRDDTPFCSGDRSATCVVSCLHGVGAKDVEAAGQIYELKRKRGGGENVVYH